MTQDTYLSTAEFDQLDDFLASEHAPSDAMDSTMVDGYLAAIASGPNLVMPDQMLRWVWDAENGDESPEFESKQQGQAVSGLITRHYRNVNDALNDGVFTPRISVRGIEAWCSGYYVAISADTAAWKPLLLLRPKLLSMILSYCTTDGNDSRRKKMPIDQSRDFTADSLSETAKQIHAFWLEQRRLSVNRGDSPGIMPAPDAVRTLIKVGRNEQCPCGSGKKYKDCHGGSDFGGAGEPERRWLH